MRYFAYGSNMDPDRIKERCPNARFICTALLPGYQLAFQRYSRNNGCWTAGIKKAENREVWGVVYEINDPLEIDALRKAEGYRPNRPIELNAHIPFKCTVFDDGKHANPLPVETFVVNRKGDPPPDHRNLRAPNEAYKTRLVNSGEHWRLPREYIKSLEAIKAVQ